MKRSRWGKPVKIDIETIKHPIHLACGTDQLRPVFDYIYFHNDMIYATDTQIAIRIPYKDVVLLGDTCPNGKCLSSKVWKFIMGKKYLISDEGILITDYGCLFKFDEPQNKVITDIIPKLDKLFSDFEKGKTLGEIAMSSKNIHRIGMILRDNNLHFQFDQANKAILVSKNNSGDVPQAILMPVMINN